MSATMGPNAFQHLLSPLDVGASRAKNRIVFPAVLPNYASANAITERTINYYGERARGGAGMIVTEALVVHPTTIAQPSVIAIFEDRNRDGLARMADAVESEDCRLVGQLWHVGRQQLWNPVSSPVGVSAQPDAFSWTVPHVMDEGEINEIRDAFVDCAKRLSQLGFSGVELHGAHGYLIGQFLSPWSNTRDDGWGGNLEGRTRFAREIIKGIRAECGDALIIGLKMPGDEGVAGGIDPDEAARIVEHLREHAKLDYFVFSQGNFSLSLEDHVPDMHYAPGPFLSIHKRLKKVAGDIPVMAVGRIQDAASAEEALGDGVGDLMALGRALVADAALPRKLSNGRIEDVRPCTFCNMCWGEIHAGKPMACIHNPELARDGEATYAVKPSNNPNRIVIVGSGVAGLEAAWVTAARGHAVTLFGHALEGGGARLEAGLPGRAETAKVYQRQLRLAKKHGVELSFGKTVSVEEITDLKPDHVVLATGAHLQPPALADQGHGEDVRAFLRRGERSKGQGVAVLFDQDHTSMTYSLADLLAERYDKLVIVTPRVQLARAVPYVSAIGIYRRLYRSGAEIVLASTPVSAPLNALVVRNAFTNEEQIIEDVTTFVWATPRIANDELAAPLKAAGIPVTLVGDARSPRGMLAAIHEAHQSAASL